MKNLKLTSRVRMPYGGMYAWQDPMLPNSGLVQGTTWSMLVDRARARRYANSIPTGLEFEEEIERDICRQYPAECSGWDETIPRPRSLTMSDVLHGTQVLIAHKAAGSPLETADVATARAKICADNNCGQNVVFQKRCGSCMDVEKLVQSIVGNSHTPHDAKLNSCSVCGCALKAAVWVPLEFQAKGTTEEQRQKFKGLAKSMESNGYVGCWKSEI